MIFFLSKAWDETQRLRHPFYLEGDSLLWCTKKSRYYALSSPFPLYTYSDHMPLKWMEKTEKGPISSFILENLSEMETIHQYIQGKVTPYLMRAADTPCWGRSASPRADWPTLSAKC